MSRQHDEARGSSRTEAFAKQLEGLSVRAVKLDAWLERLDGQGVWITHINFRAPTDVEGSWLVVIRARGSDGKVVAFHDGPTFWEALNGTLARIENGTLRFKEDKPYGG